MMMPASSYMTAGCWHVNALAAAFAKIDENSFLTPLAELEIHLCARITWVGLGSAHHL